MEQQPLSEYLTKNQKLAWNLTWFWLNDVFFWNVFRVSKQQMNDKLKIMDTPKPVIYLFSKGSIGFEITKNYE